MKSLSMKRFLHLGFLITTLIGSLWIVAPTSLQPAVAEASGTRCSTSSTTKFLRFDYVPAPNAGYIPGKSIIYVPKEAQCQGTFPLYILLHGNNGQPGDVSNYYLPQDEPGNGTERGTGRFQRAIEAAMSNTKVPGMIFVVPANSVEMVSWSGLNGPLLKQKVQEALSSDPGLAGQNIQLSNDVLISGHSGAVCGNDLTQLRSLNPIGVAVLDGCSSIYSTIVRTFSSSTILLYAADMAYDSGTFVNGQERNGYHNDVPTSFQNLAQCDSRIFVSPPRVGSTHNPGRPGATDGHPADEVAHFKQYWQNPQRGCTKDPNHPWYSLFANTIDHVGAVGSGMKTFLNLVYNDQPPPETIAGTGPNPLGQTNFNNNPQAGSAQQVTVPLAVGQVGLEASINGSTSIDGGGQGYILNYARILFVYIGGLAGTLALLMLIVSGIQIIIGGSGDQIKKSTERIINTLGGLALLASSGFILYLINPCFFTFGTSQTCVPRAINGVNYFPAGGALSVGSVPLIPGGNPPAAPQATCDANNICDVRLPARFIVMGSAPSECEYAGNCATTPNLADHTDDGRVNHKWSGVSCGAAATLIAINYVKGINMPFRDFINNYYRCGIRDLPPDRAARIGGYSAASAPRAWNDNLCAYVLGAGGDPNKLSRIMKQEFNIARVRTITPDPDSIYAALGQGNPIVIGGISTMGTANRFVPRAHFTTIVGIQGYNATTHQFTNLLIHDVGYGGGANNILTWENYNTIRSSIGTSIAVGL